MSRRKKKPSRAPSAGAAPAAVDVEAPPAKVVPVLSNRWDAMTRLERLASDARRAAAARDRGVREARAAGASWVEVADVLGVSRQAARQRYGAE